LIPDLADLNHAQTGRAVLANQVFGDVSWHLLIKDKEVLILLEDLDWVLQEAVAKLSAAVSSYQVEVQGLSIFTPKCVLEAIRVVLYYQVDCLLALGTERCPLATHKTDQTRVRHLDHMAP